MKLQKLAQKVIDSFGLGHQTNLGVLRHYIKNTPEKQLIEEIKAIGDAKILRTLWEAGLSATLQEEVLNKMR